MTRIDTALNPRIAPHGDRVVPIGHLVDVSEAALRLGTPVRFVRRLVAERRIKFYKVGKYVRFDTADLDEFIQAGQVEPDEPICS